MGRAVRLRIINQGSKPIEKEKTDNLSGWYDELFAKTDIVKLVSSYVPLNKKGATHWGCCPFHHEKTPSFTVNDSKQLYYCFGCKEGGNALTFVKKIESVDGIDAVKILAKAAGMQMPEKIIYREGGEDSAKKRERLYALMRDAAKHYHENLMNGKAKSAGEYLNSRGIDKRLAVKFGLGYSLDGRACIEFLKNLGYTEQEMKEAGIAEMSANGWYDTLYDRLIIPIINTYKEVVAFGGRTLKANPEFAKYKNSPQTLIFNKSKTVYGLNLVKIVKREKGLEYIIMTEGYMDVISLHKAGFTTAVASMGTSLTVNQARQLKNVCDKVYISYDGDSAGQQMTLRGLDILADAGLNVKVVYIPDSMDPDDVIRARGADFYKELLAEAKTLPAFKIDTLRKQYDLSVPEEKSRYAVEAIKVVKALENPVEREEYLKLVQAHTNYSMAALSAQADITVNNAPENRETPEYSRAAAPEKKSSAEKSVDASKRFILASLAEGLNYAAKDEDLSEIFDDELTKEIYKRLTKNHAGGKAYLSPLYSLFSDEHHATLDAILNYNFVSGDGEAKYRDCVNKLKCADLERRLEQKKVILSGGDKDALKEYMELSEKLRLLKAGSEGGQD